jgi:hypothetical protein
MRIKILYKKSGVEEQAKRDTREAKKGRSKRDNCRRRKQRKQRRDFRGNDTQVPLKSHGEPAGRTKDFRRGFISSFLRRGGLLFGQSMRLSAKAMLQSSQLAADGSAKETVIADLDKSMRENMLQKTLKKLLDGEGRLFELTGIGNTVLKGNLRSFHGAAVIKRKQASIADGNPMDVGSQILESGLPIANGLAMNDPFF